MSYLWKTNKDLQRAFRLHLVASSPPPICSLFSPWPVLIWIKHYIRIFQAQHKHKYPVYCLLTPRPADAGVVVFQSQQCSWQDQDECAQYYAKYVDTPGPGGDQPPAPPGTVMGDWQQRRLRTGVHWVHHEECSQHWHRWHQGCQEARLRSTNTLSLRKWNKRAGLQ